MSITTLKKKNAQRRLEHARQLEAAGVIRRLFDGLRSNVTEPPASLGAPPAGYKWNKLFPFGTRHRYDFPDGSMTFDHAFFEAMVRNFAKVAATGAELPVDYYHRGTSGNDPVRNEDKVAAGWIGQLKISGDGSDQSDGLWGAFKWNDKAKAHILADELRYLSPTFREDAVDRTTGLEQGPTLFGAALLNDPFLQDLPKVAAAAHPKYPEHRRMDHATACKHFGLDPEQTSPEQLAEHMKKAGAMYQKAGGAKAPAPSPADGDGKEPGGAVDPDGDGEPDGGPQADGGAGGAVHVHVHADGESKRAASDGTDKRALSQIASRLASVEKENRSLKAQAEARAITALHGELLAGDHITAAQKESVTAMAAKVGVDEARKFFSQFKTGLQGERGLKTDPENLSAAAVKTPEEAMKNLDGQVQKAMKELNLKETEAYMRVYGSAENAVLISMANSVSRPR